jgi:hypothetical protein
MASDRRGILPEHLKGEERQKAIDEPGPTWKEWAVGTWLKFWVGLGFLIVDGFAIVALLQAGPSVGWKVAAAVAVLPLGYMDFLAWSYLWGRLPADPKERREFHPTWRRPFAVGRLNPDYAAWQKGELPSQTEGIPPEEFI